MLLLAATVPTSNTPSVSEKKLETPKPVQKTMDHWRQLGIVTPYELEPLRVTVIGAGGIGSPSVLALAKMGIRYISVYDDDVVDFHNLPNQLYRFSDVGEPKVSALAGIVNDFTGVVIDPKNVRFEDQRLSGIVISAVDSMTARQKIWQRVRYNPAVKLYIEARMGAEVARIHTVKNPVNPSLVKWYETTLHSDEEAVETPCTERAIIYNVFMIASLVSNQVKKFAKGEDLAREIIFDMATFSFLSS